MSELNIGAYEGDNSKGVMSTYEAFNEIKSRGYNILDFGAIGDGVANDAPAFQTAIDAIDALGGGSLYIPNGTYLFTSSLYLGNVNFVGESMGSTIINVLSTTSFTELGTGSRNDQLCIQTKAEGSAGYGVTEVNFKWSDLTVNYTVTSGTCDTLFSTKHWVGGGMDNVAIHTVGCTLSNTCHIVDLYEDCRNLVFTNCMFNNGRSLSENAAEAGGFFVENSGENITFINCEFHNTTSDETIALWSNETTGGVCQNISFYNCHIEHNNPSWGVSTAITLRKAAGDDVQLYSTTISGCKIVTYSQGIRTVDYPVYVSDTEIVMHGGGIGTLSLIHI